jgi:hypothetical protein
MEDGKGAALKADGAEIGGSAFLDELFRASGEVRLVGAKISGELNCGGGTFENRTEKGEGSALSADGAEIGGSAFLRQGFRAAREVRLLGAKISGDLSCRGGTFENRTEDGQGSALTADGATIHGGLFLDNGFRSEGQVRLTHAKAGILQDDQDCWPGAGCLVIDGFQYERIAGGSPTDAKTRIEWLRVQYPAPPAGGSYLGVWQRRRPFFVRSRKEGLFWPQPYEELAAVLLASGKPAEARKIHIAKEIDRNRYGQMGWGGRLFRRLVFGATIGYGYSLRRLFWCGVAMVAIGTAFFWWAGQAGQMQAPGVTDPPDFCPPVYSLDSLLPVVDLYQERYWRPHPGGLPGCIAGVYLWFHVSLGWMLATLGVVGITGLAKKELPRK